MSKNKPRHNPNKKANLKGKFCDCCEEINGHLHCEMGVPENIVRTVCRRNPHNCCKVVYRKWAGKSLKNDEPHVSNRFNNW